MDDIRDMLEFQKIIEQLKEYTVTKKAAQRLEQLEPELSEKRLLDKQQETTQAREMLEQYGNPPLSQTEGISEMWKEAQAGALLTVEQLEQCRQFAILCSRLKHYLVKCRDSGNGLAAYGTGVQDLSALQNEIEHCIRNGRVDDNASSRLKNIRQKMEQCGTQIRLKLESILRGHKEYFSEGFVSNRNGRYTLPVKKEYKGKVDGTVIDTSSTKATYFIEPAAVARMRQELEGLEIEEENEVRVILYTLSSMVADSGNELEMNLGYVEELDYIFAKGKLSVSMDARAPHINTQRKIRIEDGRHPLLCREGIVPLNIELRGAVSGIIITGPNTGGKTVALKTVGLLSVMAQCGLHIPCADADIAMNSGVFCDIGDGQSISENLSTFSAHMHNVIRILQRVDGESLILLDELGSGTDPAEGMGIAVAVLMELKEKGCNFIVTTHYPEVKEYGEQAEGIRNARMAFDKESLKPLYRLEVGEAGESCALYIAKELGMPEAVLANAWQATYGEARSSLEGGSINRNGLKGCNGPQKEHRKEQDQQKGEKRNKSSRIRTIETDHKAEEQKKRQEELKEKFSIGDCVMVYPQKKIGIVFSPADEKGEVGVQIQKQKLRINHRRLKMKVAADQMYPEGYDFSIVFDTVENRKARHQMDKKYVEGLEIKYGDEV